MSKIIILNHEARLLQIAFDHLDPNSPCCLSPGANEVDEEVWKKCKTLKMVQVWLKTPTDNQDERPSMILEEATGLPARDVAGARTLISQVKASHPEILQGWLEGEKRADIRVMIEDRIAEIEAENLDRRTRAAQGKAKQ
jgi:hypothetical protein